MEEASQHAAGDRKDREGAKIFAADKSGEAMKETLERVRERFSGLPLEEASQPSPIFELMQGAHDRLYSRLFQS